MQFLLILYNVILNYLDMGYYLKVFQDRMIFSCHVISNCNLSVYLLKKKIIDYLGCTRQNNRCAPQNTHEKEI